MWVSIYSINQSQVQRYISCKTLGHAKMWVFPHAKQTILLAESEGSCPDKSSFISQVFVCEHGWLVGNCESGCVFWPHHVLHLQELWPTWKWWYKYSWSGKCACDYRITHHQVSVTLFFMKRYEMFFICKPDASLPCDGYSGSLPRNPWLVCGCCI